MATVTEYIPGVCNIGKSEINQRLRFGWIGAVLTLALGVVFSITHANPAWRILLFFIAAGSATGLLQAYMHFCAKFGFSGVFNFGPDVGKTDTVMQAEFRTKDRQKALGIVGLAVLIGAVAVVISLLLN